MASREFTSSDVAIVVRELRQRITDSVVSNVYQLDNRTLLFKLHKTDQPPISLVAEAGKRLHLTNYVIEKPVRPPAFCMAVRKYLRNARLLGIEQQEFDRVAVFSFRTYEGIIKVMIELFGEGNVILVGEKDTIIQALTYRKMKDRNILRGEQFRFAPSSGKNPYSVTDEEIIGQLKTQSDTQVIKVITRFLSVGGIFAEEILARARVDKFKPVDQLNAEEDAAIMSNLRSLLVQIKEGSLEPHVVLDQNDGLFGVAPFKLKRYEGSMFKLQMFPTYNEALDEFYSKSSAIGHALENVQRAEQEAEAARIERIIAEQQETLSYANKEADQLKRAGDLIYTHFNDLQAILDKFLNGEKTGKQWNKIAKEILAQKQSGLKPFSSFDSLSEKQLAIKVFVEGMGFNLSLKKNLFENAAEFYDRGKRVRQKSEGAATALKEYQRRLEEIRQKISSAKELELVKPIEAIEELEKRKVRKKEWFEKFRWFISSEGFLAVAGRDAVTNEILIKKQTAPNDIVFHADIVGAPFVTIKTEGKTPTKPSLDEAAEFAAAFSRAWREGFSSVDVYWVKPEQLSKGGPAGESVGHGAFVVRGERNWMRGTTLSTAIGIQIDEKKPTVQILGGPVGAIKQKTNYFIVIVPGDLTGRDLFKSIIKQLAEKTPKSHRRNVLELSPESIREFVPFGKASLLKNNA